MAERIFPTQPQSNLGSALEFNGINIDTVLTKLAETEEENKKSVLTPEMREQIAQLQLAASTIDDDEEVLAETKEAKKAIPEAFKEHMFKPKGAEEEEKEDEEDEEVKEVEGKSSKEARRRRVRFTSASQLSAEALQAAKDSGDEELHAAILAARSDVRKREAARLLSLSEQALKKEASTVKARNNYRMTVVESAENTQKAVTASTNSAKNSETGFKTVKSMTEDEKDYFRKVALSKGFPAEYVNSMFAVAEADNAQKLDAENAIRELMASAAFSVEAKKSAVSSLIKTAVLDNENIARLKKYWKEDLGYGDEEWVDDLFTTKYN